MLAVIYESVESSFQEIMKDAIKQKYPSIEFEVLNRASIVTKSPPETVILVINEEALSDGFIEIVKNAYPKMEHFICLVSPDKYEEYYSRYSSSCKILKQNKKDIRMWFESIDVEPNGVEKQEEELLIDDLVDFDLDDLDFEVKEEENSEGPSLELDNDFDELPDLELPDIDDLLDDVPEKDNIHEKTSNDLVDDFPSEQKSEGLTPPTYEEDLLEDLLVNDENENNDSDEISEEPDELLLKDEEMEEKTEEPEPLSSKEEKQPSSEELKKIKIQKRMQKYEEKIISLREELNIPVWKKRQIQSKTIGIWSPLHRIGVTTLTINLALYLASLSIPVAVLEGITKNLKMKSLLEIYSQKRKWISYNAFLEEDRYKVKDTIWTFKDVNFFPLEERDLVSKWNEQKIYYFMNGLKFHDILFIDFPTGEMAPYTIESLQYVDELWIVMNNDLLSMMEWKEYIKQTVKPKVDVYGFFLDAYPFNKPKKLVEQMDLPFLSSLPALYEEVTRNYYEAIPLIEHEGVYEKIENDLLVILEHFTGEKPKKGSQLEKENGIFNRFAKRLKRW